MATVCFIRLHLFLFFSFHGKSRWQVIRASTGVRESFQVLSIFTVIKTPNSHGGKYEKVCYFYWFLIGIFQFGYCVDTLGQFEPVRQVRKFLYLINSKNYRKLRFKTKIMILFLSRLRKNWLRCKNAIRCWKSLWTKDNWGSKLSWLKMTQCVYED